MLNSRENKALARPWQVIGVDVIAPDGERIGRIEDVLVDKRSNLIREIVVGIGGLGSIGDRFERLAFCDLEYSADDEAYVAPFSLAEIGHPQRNSFAAVAYHPN